MGLTEPSRTIEVTPAKKPQRAPAQPAPAPKREPARPRRREREKVPA